MATPHVDALYAAGKQIPSLLREEKKTCGKIKYNKNSNDMQVEQSKDKYYVISCEKLCWIIAE